MPFICLAHFHVLIFSHSSGAKLAKPIIFFETKLLYVQLFSCHLSVLRQ